MGLIFFFLNVKRSFLLLSDSMLLLKPQTATVKFPSRRPLISFKILPKMVSPRTCTYLSRITSTVLLLQSRLMVVHCGRRRRRRIVHHRSSVRFGLIVTSAVRFRVQPLWRTASRTGIADPGGGRSHEVHRAGIVLDGDWCRDEILKWRTCCGSRIRAVDDAWRRSDRHRTAAQHVHVILSHPSTVPQFESVGRGHGGGGGGRIIYGRNRR